MEGRIIAYKMSKWNSRGKKNKEWAEAVFEKLTAKIFSRTVERHHP